MNKYMVLINADFVNVNVYSEFSTYGPNHFGYDINRYDINEYVDASLGIFEGNNEEEAIDKAIEKYKYDKEIMTAYKLASME